MKSIRLIAAASLPLVVALGASGLVLPAGASTKPHTVNVNRTCSKGSLANLQLQREDNGTMSLDFGVDMAKHTSGVTWSVRVVDNGKVVVNSTTRTLSDGSFSITRSLPKATASYVTATAKNTKTGELCSITAKA